MSNTKLAQQIAEKLYQGFCDQEGASEHGFQKVWDQYESVHGRIVANSPVDLFILQAIAYGVLSGLENRPIAPIADLPQDNEPLVTAWKHYTDLSGPVEPGSLSARLFEQAALYGLENRGI